MLKVLVTSEHATEVHTLLGRLAEEATPAVPAPSSAKTALAKMIRGLGGG